jgi:hypothetical protein
MAMWQRRGMTATGGARFVCGGDWQLHVELSRTISGAVEMEGWVENLSLRKIGAHLRSLDFDF